MDIATILGIVLGAVMVVFGIITSGGVSAMGNFIDPPSIVITIGGSLSSLLSSYTMPEVINNLKGLGVAFKDPKMDHGAVIRQIITCVVHLLIIILILHRMFCILRT